MVLHILKLNFLLTQIEHTKKKTKQTFEMNLLLLISLTFLPIVWTSPPTTDLVDFEFDGVNNSEKFSKSAGIDRIDVNLEEPSAGDDDSDSNAFDAKEQRIRDSLAQATKDVHYKKKFAQLLPIMRTLTKQQRLVLASLISAQTSARSSGNVMNFAQVSCFYLFMFF